MCGIVGIVQPNNLVGSASHTIAEMTASLGHRGPDEQGIWQSQDKVLSLGHQRLAIIDLSPTGGQPFTSKDNNYALVFNGEIYNHRQLREELYKSFDIKFEGTSDTEILFYALVHWGVEVTLPKLRGMFAFGFYSRKDARIFLARDRAGEKPLYYGSLGDSWGFSSELKALLACRSFDRTVDTEALATFFKHGYIPAPLSIWRGIRKLMPGSYLVFDLNKRAVLKEESYWRASPSRRIRGKACLREVESQLHQNLIKAVDEQLIADVPVGAFLSGGIDSSLVVAIAAAELGKDIKTFSIGFEEKGIDESVYASSVASHLGTNHANWRITANDALNVIPRLSGIFDEPFGDPSAIPTVLVSYFAKQEVTVALTGDGADELFAGYSRYHNPKLHAAWYLWRVLASAGGDYLKSKWRLSARLAKLMTATSFPEFYASYTAQWINAPMVIDTRRQHHAFFEQSDNDIYNQMRALDFGRYLPDCILTKVDRSSMANSLESRVPFLDVRVIETAFATNARMMVRQGGGKLALKNILATYLPRHEFDRPKKGFSIPLAQWLLRDLRELSDYYLSEAMLKKSGLLDHSSILLIWERLKNGREEYQQPIWLVLIFQLWFEEHFK